jgi:hypothetical protein
MDFAYTSSDLDRTMIEWLNGDDFDRSMFESQSLKMGYVIWTTYCHEATIGEILKVWSQVTGFTFPDHGDLMRILDTTLSKNQQQTLVRFVSLKDPRTA